MGLWFVRIYGWLAMGGMLLWCVGGAGIYGSPLPTFQGTDRIKLVAILTAGPVSAFVAGLIAGHLPKVAMACLIAGATIAASVLLIGYRNADFPVLSAVLIAGPMLLGALCLFSRATNPSRPVTPNIDTSKSDGT